MEWIDIFLYKQESPSRTVRVPRSPYYCAKCIVIIYILRFTRSFLHKKTLLINSDSQSQQRTGFLACTSA